MILNELDSLLEELGRAIGIQNLKSDDTNTCLIRIKGSIDVQLEMDGDFLLIGTDFGEVPLGRYRQDLFEAALKNNEHTPPLYGIFAFSKKQEHFIMFDRLFAKGLTGQKIADFLAKFVEKALVWKKAVANSEVPVVTEMTTSDHVGIFGLKP